MFPETFVRRHVEAHSKKGDWVFDPFCGRGTTVLESLLLGRNAAGSDLNPVAFCISRAKVERPMVDEVKKRIDTLEERFAGMDLGQWEREIRSLPAFFRRAFYPATLRELLFMRSALNWRTNRTERFIAATILGSLHGEMDRSRAYFSNQMPRTICLKPDYSLRYWKEKRLFPKKRKVFEMLRQKVEYRLRGFPDCATGEVKLVDARKVSSRFPGLHAKVALVITSPPYLNVTCYEEDQWLRLWFLGGEAHPTYGKVSKDDRHTKPPEYWQFLNESWAGLAPLMRDRATLVIRLGAIGLRESEMTAQLSESVKSAFPNARFLQRPRRSELIKRQTRSFIPASKGCLFEMDFVFAVEKSM
jgi:hypothetical protein